MTYDGWLTDDAGDVLFDDTGEWLSAGEQFAATVVPGRVGYQLDVCNNFARIGVCDVFTFAGVLHRNNIGEWQADIPEGGIEFDGDAIIADVDSVILWETNPARIVYAGSMVSVGSVTAGLATRRAASGVRWTLSGVDLFGLLNTRVAYPDPTSEAPWADGYDERTGPASTVAAEYIAANLGNTALTDREIAGVQTDDSVVGDVVTWTARLQPVGQLVTQICNAAGIVCKATMPTPGTIRYTLTTGADRTSQTVISESDLTGDIDVTTAASRASFVIAGGSGVTTARLFAAAGGGSGLDRVESFYDVNNLTNTSAVALAAQGSLLESQPETAVEFGRIPATLWRYPTQFDLGDLVTVEADGVRYPVLVDGVAFTVNPRESQIRPVIGRTTNNEAVQMMRALWGTADRFNTNIV